MFFSETNLSGSFLITPELRQDERGFFARVYCEQEFRAAGLHTRIAQCSLSFNSRKHTLRGMHFQAAPYAEVKLIRCTSGAIFDVIIDLRPGSMTFRKYFSAVLSAENRKLLYVPDGFAHGFLTLEDSTEVSYQISQFYSPEHARGVRWNDPAFGIEWPVTEDLVMSERDRNCPDFDASLL